MASAMLIAADPTFATKKMDALLFAWEAARNPNDPKWRQQWADVMIAAGCPCWETRQNGRGEWFQIDAGADGWRAWANHV